MGENFAVTVVRSRLVEVLLPVSVVYVLACRLFELVVLLGRGERSKELEILVLRHELSVLRRQARRPRFTPGDPSSPRFEHRRATLCDLVGWVRPAANWC